MSILVTNKNETSQSELTEQQKLALQRYIDRIPIREGHLSQLYVKTPFEVDEPERVNARKAMLDNRDNLSLERLIGNNDLFPLHYLEKGLRVAKSICRIVIKDGNGRNEGFGTGFMVAPNLLLTNNHVLPDKDYALSSRAQFNYEVDENFNPRTVQEFQLSPNQLYITNKDLDYTLVAIQGMSAEGVDIQEFGFLPLIKQTGKALLGEYVSIIQHPKGDFKAVVLRENQITDILDNFIHYSADTEPGSSGSTVFNDQWQVIALHHSSVPDPNHDGQFIANEGVRVSSILADIDTQKSVLTNAQRELLSKVGGEGASADSSPSSVQSNDDDESVVAESFALERFEQMSGYDPKFLGNSFAVPLPDLRDDLMQDAAPLIRGGGHILNYTHFSIVMSKSRRLAFYTVVNIDGKQLKGNIGRSDKWRFDPRIDQQFQIGNELYKNNPLDRGHLVRRRDPIWGTDAIAVVANEDTFHFTNCSPQHEQLNQGKNLWLGLEDHILNHVQNMNMKATVFTGPVFRDKDKAYRGIKLPEEFWKVVVVVMEDGKLDAVAFLLSQKELISNLEAAAIAPFRTFQVKISSIEALTGLSFGTLRMNDPLEAIEMTTDSLPIERVEDIRL
ncbi:DNA/RNA non-specific endonuclease [Paenibacillus sp. Leaf72]|uniref:DNA/RNA non-specific endonuclease n=1 Tax=Paenibacillus sp. Leaf72 TaxID=1736234 RepID=UPI0006F27261|nr:DNA/RNA non-specific endonuclease [Paenibacillus sp. Leaf72]KQN97099.1 endonuclease [Paenibacillus sp. Leaf72]